MRRSKVWLWMMMVLVAMVAVGTAWGVNARRRRLADDHGRFYTHEEVAVLQAFNEASALQAAAEAEREAEKGGPEADGWWRKVVEARERAEAAGRTKREYEWRASLKKRGW